MYRSAGDERVTGCVCMFKEMKCDGLVRRGEHVYMTERQDAQVVEGMSA